jgi:hypothetical protein
MSLDRAELAGPVLSPWRDEHMPRYFFDIHDGVHDVDNEGTELHGIDEARRQAAKMAGRLLSDNAQKFWSGDEWKITVRDERDLVLFTLIFLAVDAPATSRNRSSEAPEP